MLGATAAVVQPMVELVQTVGRDVAAHLDHEFLFDLIGVFSKPAPHAAVLGQHHQAAGFGVVISGHSHAPKQEVRNGVLYFNPGSAGPQRFKLPVTLGRLIVEDGKVRSELVNLLATDH